MTGSNSIWEAAPFALFGTMILSLGLGASISNCVNKESLKAQKPLEDIVFIEGVPGMPASNLGYFGGTYLGFPLRTASGDYLCIYEGDPIQNPLINRTTVAIIDAHEDKQQILVNGKLDGQNLKIYKISHPDFGLFTLKKFTEK